jgi:hypothetical protein
MSAIMQVERTRYDSPIIFGQHETGMIWHSFKESHKVV